MFIHFARRYFVIIINTVVFIIYFYITEDDTMVYEITSYPNIFNCLSYGLKCNVSENTIFSKHNVYDGAGDVIIYNRHGFSANFKINALMSFDGNLIVLYLIINYIIIYYYIIHYLTKFL